MTLELGKGDVALETAPIGFGCMGLTAFYGEATPEEKAIEVLRGAFDLGVRHFDTAQVYARKDKDGTMHYNEELIGKFLATLSEDERKEVSVATKFYPASKDWDEEKFREATLKSKERLGVDSIDLYYFHRVFPKEVATVDVWMGAAKKLVEEGVIKRIGLSEAGPKTIREAHAIHPITCIQQEWSLFARDLEAEVVPTCKELGIGIVAYSPIGRGFLAGAFKSKAESPKDWRKDIPYLQEENIDKNLQVLEEMKAMAEEKNCTVGQLCLAWVMAKGAVPIPGTTKLGHVEDNMGALLVTLSEEEVQKLGELGNKVSGARANEDYMSRTFHTNG